MANRSSRKIFRTFAKKAVRQIDGVRTNIGVTGAYLDPSVSGLGGPPAVPSVPYKMLCSALSCGTFFSEADC